MTQLIITDTNGKPSKIDGLQTDVATIDRQFRDKDTALIGFKSATYGVGTMLLVKENITHLIFLNDDVDI